jgi:Domain of unknown function (DUF4382)
MRLTFLAAGAVVALAACTADSATRPAGTGHLALQLTDAPFPFDSVAHVDVFVVRVDARLADVDSAEAEAAAATADDVQHGWTTLATPDRSFDLLALRGGTVADLGGDDVPAGSYRGFRLIIDPSRSSVTLVDGTVLTGGSQPSVTFPSAAHSGIKINLSDAVEVQDGASGTLLIDFDLEQSFVMRGNSIFKNGLLFKPVIKASMVEGS